MNIMQPNIPEAARPRFQQRRPGGQPSTPEPRPRTSCHRLLAGCVLMILCVFAGGQALAQPDLYLKDTPADTGVEPNLSTGPMWVTEDIWVRRSPDPAYQATPFPEVSPPWIPLAHQNPEYRDPIYSVPNYVYVRIRNRGTAASTGNERLKVYWAKASTGLSWDSQWVDYLDNTCGPTKLYGEEITKPRKNAATASATERNNYRDAIIAAGTLPALEYADGVSYWHKQDVVHQGGPPNRHGTPAFLPWHREYINRYEVLLRKANPLVRLLYWDWTTDPENSTGGFNFFTSTFMGASGRGTGGVSIGAPFLPSLLPPAVTRNLNPSTSTPADPDSSILANANYPLFRSDNEGSPNHNSAHGYIGGGGNMSFVNTAAEDPFFFVLHANVDRLWAQWQRDPSAPTRLETATTYDGNSSNINITSNMGPWDGSTTIDPWTTGPFGGHIVVKTAKDTSVVSPPIYDTAPLTIPALAPGEAVVIQIPWYPPNPADFSCFGTDQKHFCLLARVETAIPSPFGMTFPEGTGIYTNTKNNNNIAWKNITVVDDFTGPLGLVAFFVRNVFDKPVKTGLNFVDDQDFGPTFLEAGRIFVDLGPALYERWVVGGRGGKDVRDLQDGNRIEVLTKAASLKNIMLAPNETLPVNLQFELYDDYQPVRGELPKWDVIQVGTPDDPEAIVGGNRYELDFSKLGLVPARSQWRYLDSGKAPAANWKLADYDDSSWKVGKARLGTSVDVDTRIDGGTAGDRNVSAYFRHTFEVEDPSFYRTLMLRLSGSDGAVVYLNGSEIHRINMPSGAPRAETQATRQVQGLEAKVFVPVEIPAALNLLTRGRNVITVETHQRLAEDHASSFDLELSANALETRFPPDLQFSSPIAGTMLQVGETIAVTIDALDPDADGDVTTVSLLVDGEEIGEAVQGPPFSFEWTAGTTGIHRLRAIATDSDRERTTADLTVSVVENTPPDARLVEPRDHDSFQTGEKIQANATAFDLSGKVERVEFYVRSMKTWFTEEPQKIGVATEAPFTAHLTLNEPGHYMLYAVAYDGEGLGSQSNPAHFEVRAASSDSISSHH